MTPDDTALCYNLGVAYSRMNDMKNSLLFFQKALKINPDYIKAKIALRELQQYNNAVIR